MRVRLDTSEWTRGTRGLDGDIAKAATETMDIVTVGVKETLRAQVTGSGMGTRLANTWRGQRYPRTGNSINAAAFVYSNAPNIVDAFDRGATIVPLDGKKYLAIPTDNVPARKRGGGFGGRGTKMNPFEVETSFNQDLRFTRTHKGTLIAFIDKSATKGRRGYRRAHTGRSKDIIVMFILIPSARIPKKLDIDAAANEWAGRVQSILADRL